MDDYKRAALRSRHDAWEGMKGHVTPHRVKHMARQRYRRLVRKRMAVAWRKREMAS